MTLVLNRPPDTAAYLKLFDDSTEGCGLLGGPITSRSGERRDLDAECGPSLAKWASRAARDHADIALMMIGAWDLFDERVDGAALPFGTPGWDGVHYYKPGARLFLRTAIPQLLAPTAR
jgi:hypothetical protein